MVKRQIIEEYFSALAEKLKTGQAREHAYRPVFEALIKRLDPTLQILNDPSRSEHGNPDFVFLRGDITAGYTETKDIGADLNKVETTKQIERYLGYSNLILTDYLEFRFYKNGQRYSEPISIGKIDNGKLISLPQNFDTLAYLLSDFLHGEPEPIKSCKFLAEIMGGKARRIRDNIKLFFNKESDSNNELKKVYETIKQLLVHDLKEESFADMYAQTLVYGLFVARYYDESADTFSRQEARDLVPASNPFLQHFFDHIAGPNFDKRLRYIVDELCEVFQHADTKNLVEEYIDADPIIHFYEDFLKEYDPELRKKMGAYYTPLPVVNFIIRSVDHILQKDFGLAQGLVDTTKLTDGRHRVQILDPAVGTGTFISATINTIYSRLKQQKQDGRWPTYVHHDLLPRLHGFELMMAPYTIAHLKLSLAFKKTGFWKFHRRLGIYLTNSLEEGEAQQRLGLSFGFAESIAREAEAASVIKNETPIMVIIGNPPYSGESNNKQYTGHNVYKLEPGTSERLKERNSKWINDDYVKFFRFAESLIEKNKEGIVGMITPHGWLDNPTFRGMRWHFLSTYDVIYVLDLHGNTKKEEKALDGSADKNVFDIQQGVGITLAIKFKNSNKDKLAEVFRADFLGSRKDKFEFLNTNGVETISWQKLEPSHPMYSFVSCDSKKEGIYKKGFSTNELFLKSSVGIATFRDQLTTDLNKGDLVKRLLDFKNLDIVELKNKYRIPNDTRDWKLDNAKKIIENSYEEGNIEKISYRPFDDRYIYYTCDSKSFIAYPRFAVMQNLLQKNNVAILLPRQLAVNDFSHVFAAKGLIDMCLLTGRTKEAGYVFPLYLYTEDGSRVSNLKKEIIDEIEKTVGKTTPEDIFDYVYAFLHSPSYREKYKESLKIDFPRVPYPKDKKQFKALVILGKELREIHLLESPKVNKFMTSYPVAGSDAVDKLSYKDGKVFINAEQYFGDVPEIAWNFWIGGYQPAQKWLKDRKGRTLSNEDIEHYQKMIVALTETDRIMEEIDKIAI